MPEPLHSSTMAWEGQPQTGFLMGSTVEHPKKRELPALRALEGRQASHLGPAEEQGPFAWPAEEREPRRREQGRALVPLARDDAQEWPAYRVDVWMLPASSAGASSRAVATHCSAARLIRPTR